jgi:hypothetical protein
MPCYEPPREAPQREPAYDPVAHQTLVANLATITRYIDTLKDIEAVCKKHAPTWWTNEILGIINKHWGASE